MKVVLGYSLEEIAQATGVPVNTVRSRMLTAKETMRQRIERDPRLADLAEAIDGPS
jgi:RNA polymerase sigma-70 factor (ECF subfamily)